MSKHRLLFILIAFSILVMSITGGSGCANIIPPAGGPKDSIPPKLESATPGDSALNFKSTRITFTFDEYVEVQDIQDQLLVSPTPRISPSVDWRLNTVTVRIRDSLEPNTTYTFNFGNAIRDINEANPVKDFTYTFSTGPYIDSLEFSGNVLLAETGKVDSTLIVMLHSNMDDSAVIKEKPRYFSKLDSRGRFVFRNLPAKTYRVYALKDDGRTMRYFDNKQLFAFADAPVIISDTTKPITLYAYSTVSDKPATGTGGTSIGGRTRGSIPTAERRLKIGTNLVADQQDLLSNLILSFDLPLRVFDSTKLSLRMDSSFTPVPDYRIIRDTSGKKLELVNKWKENTQYHLILQKDFAEDTAGKKLLKDDTVSFRSRRLADYGEVRIRFRNLDLSKNPVLVFVLNGTVTQTFPLTGIEFSQPLFLPGDYELRIIFDENRNGRWDPGEFFEKHQQPEKVVPIERRVNIKPNWENEFEIAI